MDEVFWDSYNMETVLLYWKVAAAQNKELLVPFITIVHEYVWN